MERDAGYRAYLLALRFFEMADALGAFIGINFINFRPHVNRIIRAFRLAYIAIDAIICDYECHGRSAFYFNAVFQPALNRGEYKFRDIAAQQGDFAHDGAGDELILI
jgi:hypothetical protein